ncbi:CpaF family protein [Azospirillum sp. TSO22-1]|uniref:CpaF family protein n=1 Tax=Azospirillum sp. TSO22-1 TaxID=716789 RepID=UPI000D64C969|nr:CpaF family protein [Azospirillum sp. TSO22-1]
MSAVFGRRMSEAAEAPPPAMPHRPVAVPAVAPARVAVHEWAPGRRPAIEEVRVEAMARIDPASVAQMEREALQPLIVRLVDEIATERRIQLNGHEQAQLATELVHDMLGLGPLEPLLADDSITDIMVNGPERVYIEQRGRLLLSPVRFRDRQHVLNVAQRIATGIGRRVDESSPIVDARLPDGSRVNIVVPPLALDGTTIAIRKFSRRWIDLDTLAGFRSLSPAMARAFEVFARARLNIIISGGTGSGKTTLLNALSRHIDPGERIITVEDAAELQLQQPHVVRLETRPPNLEGSGEITVRALIKTCLRLRPDRIIVGETRGAEAFDMLQAMNTGHPGSMSTIHANSTRDALSRIENMVLMGNVGLPTRAIRQQVASAVDVVIQVQRMRDGVRRVTQVSEILGLEGETVVTQDLFRFEGKAAGPDGLLHGAYRATGIRPGFMDQIEQYGLGAEYLAALDMAEA